MYGRTTRTAISEKSSEQPSESFRESTQGKLSPTQLASVVRTYKERSMHMDLCVLSNPFHLFNQRIIVEQRRQVRL
jgi:hypothetical protein